MDYEKDIEESVMEIRRLSYWYGFASGALVTFALGTVAWLWFIAHSYRIIIL